MNAIWIRRLAVAALLLAMVCGCRATSKSSAKSSAGMHMPGLPLLGKKKDDSLRQAVETDPFPRAQGKLAASSRHGIERPIASRGKTPFHNKRFTSDTAIKNHERHEKHGLSCYLCLSWLARM